MKWLFMSCPHGYVEIPVFVITETLTVYKLCQGLLI